MGIKNRFAPSGTRLHKIWDDMKSRCYNENNSQYHRYGGRGIKVCEEWRHNYQAFEDWAYSNGYREHLTIDRIDNNGNYEPLNCRWVTQNYQMRNTSKTLFIEIEGETKSITDWAELVGLKVETIRRRYMNGEHGKALIRPSRNWNRRI